MTVHGVAQTNAAAQNPSAQASQQSGSDFADQLASIMGTSSDGASAIDNGPVGDLKVDAGVQVTLPNGMTLGVFHFEEGSGSSAPSASDEQGIDNELIRSLEQMMSDFGYPPTAAADNGTSPTGRGTAAVTA